MKHLRISVIPASSEGPALNATFTVPAMDPSSPPYTVYDGYLSDGTPVKIEVIPAP